VSNLYWLNEDQMAQPRHIFQRAMVSLVFIARQGIAKQCPERDDRRELSDITFINRNGLRWCDMGVFAVTYTFGRPIRFS
jgi:hypothetical protein